MRRREQVGEGRPYHGAVSYVQKCVRGAVVVTLAFGLWWAGACVDTPVDPCSDCPPSPSSPNDSLIVSNPVLTAQLTPGHVQPTVQTSALERSVGYVSLRPNAVPAGVRAFIRRVGDATFVTTAVRDGGFDPVPVSVQEDDTIEVRVTDAGGSTVLEQRVAVRATRPPVVVRTQPPRKKKDVPLNSPIIAVFSEPVDASALASGVIQLKRGSSVVSGSLRFLESDQLSVEFVPAAPLAAGADYELVVTSQVRDLTGQALAAEFTAPFTTGSGVVGQPASLTISPDSIANLIASLTYVITATVRDGAGDVLADKSVTWSSSDLTIATVAPADSNSMTRGRVRGVSPGTVTITATSGTLSATATVTVAPPPPSGLAALTLSPDTGRSPLGDLRILTVHMWNANGAEISSNPPHGGRFVVTLTFGNAAMFPGGPSTFTSSDCGWSSDGYALCTDWNRKALRPLVEGVSTVVATSEGFSDTAIVIIGPPRAVAELRIVPTFWTFSEDSVRTLTVYLLDSAGAAITPYNGGARPLSWIADPSAVVTIDPARSCPVQELPSGFPEPATGLCAVRGTDAGSASITVSSGSHTATVGISAPHLVFKSVTAGNHAGYWGAYSLMGHTCGVTIGGATVCWGGDGGNIGDEWYHFSTRPWMLNGGLTFESVSAGKAYTCGLTPARAAYCWWSSIYLDHWNDTWSLGGTDVPQAVPGGHVFVSLDAGGEIACGLRETGIALCWNFLEGPDPAPVSDAMTFTALSVGEGHACALDASGAAYCWWNNESGQLGNGSTDFSAAPVAVNGGLSFVSLTAGAAHTCGLLASGEAYCWGRNASGELGDGTTSERHGPTLVSGGQTFTALARGSAPATTCGLTADGTLYCWGDNEWGQVGDGSTTNRVAPTPVSGGLRFSSVSSADRHTCAVTTTGVVYCWGSNEAGQLGNGTVTGSLVPVKVAGQP